MTSIDVEFVVDSDDVTLVHEYLTHENAAQVETLGDEGFLPIVGVVVAAVIAVTALANVVIRISRIWKSGVIVDARGPVIRTEKSPTLPRGTILVFSKDGTQHQISEPSTLDLASLIETVT
jgi:hypothetical protein